jgi:LysR family transcriptional regulator, hydrogen peroxide-inducible genes activator
LPAGSLSGVYANDMVVSIPFESPEPTRRVALAWREGFSRPQAIAAIIAAVSKIDNPHYRPITS